MLDPWGGQAGGSMRWNHAWGEVAHIREEKYSMNLKFILYLISTINPI